MFANTYEKALSKKRYVANATAFVDALKKEAPVKRNQASMNAWASKMLKASEGFDHSGAYAGTRIK